MTHPHDQPVTLTSAEIIAYRRGLVKRIQVASSQELGHAHRPFVRLISIKAVKRTFTARLAIHKIMANGEIRTAEVTVQPGASLDELSGGYDVYQGHDVARMQATRADTLAGPGRRRAARPAH